MAPSSATNTTYNKGVIESLDLLSILIQKQNIAASCVIASDLSHSSGMVKAVPVFFSFLGLSICPSTSVPDLIENSELVTYFIFFFVFSLTLMKRPWPS
mmetsp:Transcript_14373/g.21150  ORF Transcript_14373/g.21150 Transcript_14373/m.21150 type:complete len:99 (+) Transcript_14373:374-670(+)